MRKFSQRRFSHSVNSEVLSIGTQRFQSPLRPLSHKEVILVPSYDIFPKKVRYQFDSIIAIIAISVIEFEILWNENLTTSRYDIIMNNGIFSAFFLFFHLFFVILQAS